MLATRKLTWQCVSYDWTLCVCQWPWFLAVAWDYPKVSKSNRPGPRAPTFSRIVAAVDCTRFQQGVQDSGGWSLLTSPSKESWEGFWELLGCVPGSWYKMNAAFSSEKCQVKHAVVGTLLFYPPAALGSSPSTEQVLAPITASVCFGVTPNVFHFCSLLTPKTGRKSLFGLDS